MGITAGFAAGCTPTHENPFPGLPPAAPSALATSAWSFEGVAGHEVNSPHYALYTTVADETLADNVLQVMEGALREYQRLAPAVENTDQPMKCYLFATRDQWSQYTREHTGTDADVYLHINRGGYTVGDAYVAYFIGDVGTYSVAAHEGFHQYASRNFRQRIPPFLEEGIACMFEDVRWEVGRPHWNLTYNGGRLLSLRTAIQSRELFDLDRLVVTHAGQIVSGPRVRVSAFYGESWAFARFLWLSSDGRYRSGLQHLLTDAAKGTLHGIPVSTAQRNALWDPQSAKPLLEYYLQSDLGSLNAQFQTYMQKLVDNALESEKGG